MTIEYLIGDCREVLKTLPDNSINCCVTSPPYFGLRDYGHENQIGLERTPDDYVNELVKVFREVGRVLRDDGTVWLNIGDSYAAHKDCKSIGQTLAIGTSREKAHVIEKGLSRTRDSKMLKEVGLKNKDLIGIPWRVAFALQADGWYLRQDIIWAKGNPMPESVKDRCTKAHEYIFLLSKSAKYYFDGDAIKEKGNGEAHPCKNPHTYAEQYKNGDIKHRTKSGLYEASHKAYLTRNRRSVWNINTTPYKGAHFATFPKRLVEPCVLAGCPIGGTVLDPFGGSGTVGEVCRLHQRNAILIELNPEYEPLIKQRIGADVPELKSFGGGV